MVSRLVKTKRIFLAIAIGIVLALTALPALAEGRASGYPIAMDVQMTPKGDVAMPFNFAVQPGQRVEIRIRNYSHDLHTFAIPAIGLNVAVLPGSPQAPRTTRVSFVVPHYGIYRWFCWTCRFGLHKHHLMGGKVYAWISPDVSIG